MGTKAGRVSGGSSRSRNSAGEKVSDVSSPSRAPVMLSVYVAGW